MSVQTPKKTINKSANKKSNPISAFCMKQLSADLKGFLVGENNIYLAKFEVESFRSYAYFGLFCIDFLLPPIKLMQIMFKCMDAALQSIINRDYGNNCKKRGVK